MSLIAEHGWAVRHVGEDRASGAAAFSYTVGLTALDHPEVVITGMPFEHAQTFLNNIRFDVRIGSASRLVLSLMTSPAQRPRSCSWPWTTGAA